MNHGVGTVSPAVPQELEKKVFAIPTEDEKYLGNG